MTAALVVFSVFAGMSLVVATVAGAILLANGKLAIPGTNAHRVASARTSLELARMSLEREGISMRMDDAIQLRLNAANDIGHRPRFQEVLPMEVTNGSR